MKASPRKSSLRLEAENPATPPARLRVLARKGRAREVAANPNAPVDLLLKLVARHFDAFLANPVLPLLLLEDPGLFLKLSSALLRRLLRREDLPETLLASLLRHSDAEVRDSAALHVRQANQRPDDGSEAVLRSLAALRMDTSSLPELFALGLVPAWLSEPLAGGLNAELREFVISVLERDADSRTAALGKLYRRAGAGMPGPRQSSRPDMNLSAEDMQRLATGGPWVRQMAARHPNTPPEALARLARDPLVAVRAAALRHPFTPEEALWAGSAAVLPKLRRAVAGNPAATDAMLARLATDVDPGVRRIVAAHRYLEPAALRALAGDADATIRARVARNRLTPPEALEKLAGDADEKVRSGAAGNSRTPASAVARLATDSSVTVRAAVARRGDLPDELLGKLACDANGHVMHCARFNRSNPHELILELMNLKREDHEAVRRAFARGKRRSPKRAALKPVTRRYRFSFPARRWKEPRDPHHSDKHEMAFNRSTPPEVLARLAEENGEWIAPAVASNPQTPAAILYKLLRHPKPTWRLYHALAMNRNSPPDLLAHLAAQKNSSVKSAVAHNPSTPLELLATLARDPDPAVRMAVAHNNRTPQDVLLLLCEDREANVQKALLVNSAVPWSAVERWLPLVERDVDWRQRLARRAEMPAEWRARLLRDPEVPVRLALAQSATCRREDFEVLVHDPETSVRNALLQCSYNWSLETLEEIARTEDSARLVMVARAAHISPALAERLAAHAAAEVRAALAGNQAVPEQVLVRLAGDRAPAVQQALRSHPRCPPEAVDSWLEPGFPERDQIFAMLNCPGIREHHYRKLLALGGEDVRMPIVLNERTPLSILEELLNGEDLKNLQHIAKTRRLPDRMYEAIIARENDGALRQYTAMSYHTPREVVERIGLTGKLDDFWERRTRVMIAQQPDMRAEFLVQLLERELTRPRGRPPRWMRRNAYLRNSELLPVLVARLEIPVAKLEPLLMDESPEVRRALIGRADLPEEWRARLRTAALQRAVDGRSSWARLAALCHPETKADALRTFARTGRWLERLAITRNPAAPADALELLGTDSNSVVRAEARARLDVLQRSKS
jgi:hypothetical protein